MVILVARAFWLGGVVASGYLGAGKRQRVGMQLAYRQLRRSLQVVQ
jgi:hypothetical protein